VRDGRSGHQHHHECDQGEPQHLAPPLHRRSKCCNPAAAMAS
jgi:hypothetical protein